MLPWQWTDELTCAQFNIVTCVRALCCRQGAWKGLYTHLLMGWVPHGDGHGHPGDAACSTCAQDPSFDGGGVVSG